MGFFDIARDPNVAVNFYERMRGDFSHIKLGSNFILTYGFIRSKGSHTYDTRPPGDIKSNSLYRKLFIVTDQVQRPIFEDSRRGADTADTAELLSRVTELWLLVNVGWEISFITGNLGEKTTTSLKNDWKYDPSAQTQTEEGVALQHSISRASVSPWAIIRGGNTPHNFKRAVDEYANKLRSIVDKINDTYEDVTSYVDIEFNETNMASLPIEVSRWISSIKRLQDSFDAVRALFPDGTVTSLSVVEETKDNIARFNQAFDILINIPSGISQDQNDPNWVMMHQELLILYNKGKEIQEALNSSVTLGALKKLITSLIGLNSFQTRKNNKRIQFNIMDFIKEQNDMMAQYVYKIVELSRIHTGSIDEPEYARLKAINESNKGTRNEIDLANVNLFLLFETMEELGSDVVAIYEDIMRAVKEDPVEASILSLFSKYSDIGKYNEDISSWNEASYDIDEDIQSMPEDMRALETARIESIEIAEEVASILGSLEADELESINHILLEIDRFLLVFDRHEQQINKLAAGYQSPQEDVSTEFELPLAASITDCLLKIANECDGNAELELADRTDELLKTIHLSESANWTVGTLKEVFIKKAKMRMNTDEMCPFRMSIPFDCSKIGEAIEDMYPLEDVEEDDPLFDRAKKINGRTKRRFYNGTGEKVRCPFAESVMDDSVLCNYGEMTEGSKSIDFGSNVSGAYPMMWSGMFTMPLSWGFSGAESYMSRTPGTATNSPFGMSPGYQGYLRLHLKKLAVDLNGKGLKKLASSLESLL